jgi:hypothetical protein
MSARFLASYTSGILFLGLLLTSFVSIAPGAQGRFAAIQTILGAAALFFALVAVLLRKLPEEHWGNHSFAARCLLSVAAIASSLFVVSIGGG